MTARIFLSSLIVGLSLIHSLAAQERTGDKKKSVEPESLLPKSSLLYFRFDGAAAHSNAYRKTILADLMKEDLGHFLTAVHTVWRDIVDNELKPAADAPKDTKQQYEVMLEFRHVLAHLWQHGAAVSIEAIDADRGTATFVFPNAAELKRWPAFQRAIEKAAGKRIKTIKVRGRTIYRFRRIIDHDRGEYQPLEIGPPPGPGAPAFPPAQPVVPPFVPAPPVGIVPPPGGPPPPNAVAFVEEPEGKTTDVHWWVEGKHIVMVVGTEPVARSLDVIDGERPNLKTNSLYSKLRKFNNYETHSRGFLDLQRAQNLIVASIKDTTRLATLKERIAFRLTVAQLGLGGLRGLSWHWGYEGKHLRTTYLVDLPPRKQRRGLLKLFTQPIPSTARNLPPLPPDAASVAVHHIDWLRYYDESKSLYKMGQILDRLQSGKSIFGSYDDMDKYVKKELGFDLRNELFASLDSTLIHWKARSEGLMFLGRGVAIKVKDAKKVDAAVSKLFQKIAKLGNVNLPTKLATRTYHGTKVHYLQIKESVVAPAFAVHKGWLVLGVQPQNVKSYIWRSKFQTAQWKMPKIAFHAICRGFKSGSPKSELAWLTVDDPRPMLELVLPHVPLAVESINLALRGKKKPLLDVFDLPHAKAITTKLSHNATAVFDDDDALRMESHSTLEVPSLWRTYMYATVFAAASEWMPRQIQNRWIAPAPGPPLPMPAPFPPPPPIKAPKATAK